MKEFVLKIVRNPNVQKAFLGLVLALLTALGVVNAAGCTPAQLQTAKDVRAVTDCVNGVLKDVPLDALDKMSAQDAQDFVARIEACSKVRAE